MFGMIKRHDNEEENCFASKLCLRICELNIIFIKDVSFTNSI